MRRVKSEHGRQVRAPGHARSPVDSGLFCISRNEDLEEEVLACSAACVCCERECKGVAHARFERDAVQWRRRLKEIAEPRVSRPRAQERLGRGLDRLKGGSSWEHHATRSQE